MRRQLATAVLLSLSALQAQAQPQWQAIHSHAPDASNATAGASMQAGEALHISVSLQVRDQDGLDTLASDIGAGRSTAMLSKEQFLSQYAPTQDQVDAVVQHLSKSGFINIEVSSNKLLITADGSAATAKAAFNVEMRHYTVNQRSAYGNANDPQVPAELSNIVLAVHGLQTLHLPHTALVKAQANTYEGASANASTNNSANAYASVSAGTYANTTSSGNRGHSPASWPTIYNATAIPTAANTTIGIISAGNMTQTLADLTTFVRAAGYAAPTVSVVNVGGTNRRGFQQQSSSDDDTAEWDIDSQDALGAAGGAVKSLVFYTAPSLTDADLVAAYNAAVAANVASVINVSLGECENNAKQSGAEATDDQIFKIAVAQGQTFVVASGDAGAYECGGKTIAQSYPAVSPYVIAVGGTAVTTTAANVWTAEAAWTCASATACANNGGGGGGPSLTEAAPSWQLTSKVLGSGVKRGVPDLAFAGDPNTGTLAIVDGKTEQYGGTSLAAPIFAGFWARIQSAHANKLVFPATALYKFGVANQATLFHDVLSGSNGGYAAAKGWDYTTGFGSLNVGAFASFVTANAGF